MRPSTLLPLAALALLGCSDDPAPVLPSDGGMDAPDVAADVPRDRPPRADGALNVELIEERVFAVHCAVPSCHMGSEPTGRMNLEPGNARASLLNVTAMGVGCRATGATRVVPGNAATSLLVRKISEDNPPCGTRMPQGAPPLPQELIDLVRAWVDAGAP